MPNQGTPCQPENGSAKESRDDLKQTGYSNWQHWYCHAIGCDTRHIEPHFATPVGRKCYGNATVESRPEEREPPALCRH
jgi:hypothetical protein